MSNTFEGATVNLEEALSILDKMGVVADYETTETFTTIFNCKTGKTIAMSKENYRFDVDQLMAA